MDSFGSALQKLWKWMPEFLKAAVRHTCICHSLTSMSTPGQWSWPEMAMADLVIQRSGDSSVLGKHPQHFIQFSLILYAATWIFHFCQECLSSFLINFMVYICSSSKISVQCCESPQSTAMSLKGFVTGEKKLNPEGIRSVKNTTEP